MRYFALVSDYDGTLATTERLIPEVERALERLRVSGRRIVLITGRTYEELEPVCPRLELFDSVVLENGAVIYSPSLRQERLLCPPVPPVLAEALARRGVAPLVRGRAILATRRPHEIAVLESIRDLGLEFQIVFNGGAVMALPSGVNKGIGLRAALEELGLSTHDVVAVGNGENDHSFLDICECSVAVANAVPAIASKADFRTRGAGELGVLELIEELIATDLAGRVPGGPGDVVLLALRPDGGPVTFPPYGHNILISGPSGSGKSTFATGVMERLMQRGYQLCIVDPEGDYGTLDGIVSVGSRERTPQTGEVLERLKESREHVAVNLLGLPLRDRPDFFLELFPRLLALRARTGRPHWIVIDEVHHVLPAAWALAPSTLPQRLGEVMLITHRPGDVAPSLLRTIDTVVAIGPAPGKTLAEFTAAIRVELPAMRSEVANGSHEAVVWQRSLQTEPFSASTVMARSERLRHLRKYAEGDLGRRGFFFRGSDNRMNLRARNLASFCEIAGGIDDDTWQYHLHRGDVSAWIREVVKDVPLANEIAAIERQTDLHPADSRRMACDAVGRRYVL